jgi:hypothetical protein
VTRQAERLSAWVRSIHLCAPMNRPDAAQTVTGRRSISACDPRRLNGERVGGLHRAIGGSLAAAAPQLWSDGIDGHCSSSCPRRAYVVRVQCGGAGRGSRAAWPGQPRQEEVILVWSADGPHAIRSQSSSAINIRQLRKGWRPVVSGAADTYRQRQSTTTNRRGSRSQGGGAGSNPVGATPLHPSVSGGCSYSHGPMKGIFKIMVRRWSARGIFTVRIGPSSKII